MNLKFSIITVCYNAESTILQTIQSLNNQTYKNIEHIIVDAESTDNTLDIIKKNKLHHGKIISEKDKGIYHAFNKGLDIATGEIIGYLNADDFYPEENVLENISKCFRDEIKIVYGNVEYFDNNNKRLTGRKFIPGAYKKDSYLKSWHPPFTGFFCLKECYNKYGGFQESLKVSADFELMFRMQEIHQLKSYYLEKTITYMGASGTSAQIKNIIIGNMNIIKALKIHKKNVFVPFFIFNRIFPKIITFLKFKIIRFLTNN